MKHILISLLAMAGIATSQTTGDYTFTRKAATGYQPVILTPVSGNVLSWNGSGVATNLDIAGTYVPQSRTINGSPLSSNVTITTISGTAGTVTDIGNLTGPVTSTNRATSIANGAITNGMLANGAVASLSGNNSGDNSANTLYSGLVSNATHTGEVTGATALTITAGAVTLAKMADMATASLIYRKTAGSGAPEVNTLATLKTDLGLTGNNSGDQTSVTGNSGTATALATGRTLAVTGDLAYTSPAFNGTANVTAAGTLATVAAAGTTGSSTAIPVVTINAKGLTTSITTAAVIAPAGTLTGTALASGVTASSLTSFGAAPALGAATATTAAAGTDTTHVATTAFVTAASDYGQYKTLLYVSGEHRATRVAGTYAMGAGAILAISGTGTSYPIGLIHIVAADYPTVNGLASKLRIRMQLQCNDVAPTGTYTAGLFPVTRPATSGAATVAIYTLGTLVTGSFGATVSAPAADSSNLLASSDFALPADGLYCIAIVTTGTVATSAHIHINAQLQMHNQ